MKINIGKTENIYNRAFEFRALLFVTCVLVCLMLVYLNNIGPELKDTIKNYKEHTVINLNKNTNRNELTSLLIHGNYINNYIDAGIISERLINKLQTENLNNLGALNKKPFLLSTSYAYRIGGDGFKKRIQSSLGGLQYNTDVEQLYLTKNHLQSKLRIGNGIRTISAKVIDSTKAGIGGIVVKLTSYLLPNDSTDDQSNITETIVSYQSKVSENYAITDINGLVIFSGLINGGYYSIIPIRKWYEYGTSQGTTETAIIKDLAFTFTEKKQFIKLFDNITYSQLKENKVLTVRTPNEFKDDFKKHLLIFFFLWWILHYYLVKRKIKCDELILPLLMALTGTCILIMYAIHDPLRDELKGNEMVVGLVMGIILIGVLSGQNLIKWFNSYKFDPISPKIHSKFKRSYFLPGTLYLFLGLLLSILLYKYGTGPEGSGAKVNLFFFQPSEIIKYLMIIFFAAYFSKKSKIISQIPNPKIRIINTIFIFIGLSSLLILYILLGDLGPALVICITFIIFYSIAKGDFIQLVIGTCSYVVLILFVSSYIGNSKIILASFSLIWLVLWILYSLIKKNFYESAIFFVLVISTFIFAESLPGIGQRLKDRNDIFLNKWDNQVYGGDQVAHGIWSLCSGGLTGQGIGKGNSEMMPTHDTDMILSSIGEELGWIGLCILIVCFALLLHRSILIGRKAAHPFVFYLAGGIAMVTGLQFIIIAAGSLGIIPLTGVSVPFLSYGKMSMVINLAAFGAVLSISKLAGSLNQIKAIHENYDNTNVSGILILLFAFVVLLVFIFYYQFIDVNKFIVRPSFVINKSGERIISYNPRINLLIKKLNVGNIYDRNGLLLATSDKDIIKQNIQLYSNAGISDSILLKQINTRQNRYYPFGSNMFFWIGDYNNKLLWGNESKGFFAEERYLKALRGFETKSDNSKNISMESNKYKENRFLPMVNKQFQIHTSDYSELIPLLKAGINSGTVNKFNRKKRDITLTIDAKLQTQLQNNLYYAFNSSSFNKNWRASVVILNGRNGEVLSSALYPRPDNEQLKFFTEMSPDEQRRASNKTQINDKVFTDLDLGTCFATAPGSTAKVMSGLAAFIKLGTNAANQIYHVENDERFRISGGDPDPVGDINLENAIVHSSNVYFIKLINDHQLDNELSFIYQTIGVGINEKRGKNSYTFYNNQDEIKLLEHKVYWEQTVYNIGRNKFHNINLSRKNRLTSEFSKLAWGQGKMTTTPLVMARLTSVIANKGVMHNSKFIIKSTIPLNDPNDTTIKITEEPNAELMKKFMREQSANFSRSNNITVFGKTGTPQREVPGNKRNFDGWFMFFTHSEKIANPLVVCVRIERSGSSAIAKNLASEVVIPTLMRLEYVK